MKNYDVIIVGAGVAGLSLTSELADTSFNILLLDKKKNAEDVRYNTSGSFIDPKQWELPNSIFNPVHRLLFWSKNEVVIKEGLAYIIDRKKLLRFLEKKSRENKNLKIEYGLKIKETIFDTQGIKYLVYSKNENDVQVSARIIIDCSGASAIIGRKTDMVTSKPIIAFGAEYLVPLKKEVHTADLFVGANLKGGYGWIFPKDPRTAIVGYGTLSRECFPNVEKYLRGMWHIKRVSERCDLNPLEKNLAVFRTGKPISRFTERNLLLVGDSALQANPLIGEGIKFIMDASRIVSKWIKISIENNDLNPLKNYDKEWRKKYYKKYSVCFFLQQKIKEASADDSKLDGGVRMLRNVSDKDFVKLLSGDLNYLFLIKIAIISLLKIKFFHGAL